MKKLWIGCRIGSAGLFFSTLCHAGDHAAVEVPFTQHEHLIVVRGAIGEMDRLNLVIDTGASSTTLSRRLAGRMGLRGEKRRVLAFAGRVDVESVRIPELRLGDLRFEDVPAWIANLDFPDMKRRLRIDALIGLDVLKRTGLTIDYEARLLRFGPVGDNPNAVPFYSKLPFIPLTVRVNGEPLRLLLDTGAGELTLYAARLAGRVRIGRSDKSREIRGAAGRIRLKKVRLDDVTVGEAEWSRVTGLVLEGPSPVAEMDGVLGPMALGVKRLHLDWEAGTVGLEP